MKHRDYFYDKQIRRYLLQAIRLFSGFKVDNGKKNGRTTYKMVPCTYADMTRLGATYLNNNSSNVLNSAPMLTVHITDLQPLTEYRHTPHYEGRSHFTEKQRDENGNYINKPAAKYTVNQLMPVPFTMTINVDIWTSSTEQKHELLEQILVWFNPGFEFRVNSSPVDMGNVSNIELENIQYTSRSVPQGTATEIDVATLTFKIYPVMLSTPAKIRRQRLIQTVYTGLNVDNDNLLVNTLDDVFNQEGITLEPVVVTPSGYDLEITKAGGQFYAKLAHPSGYGNWNDLFKLYGAVEEGVTNIRISQTNDPENNDKLVYGTFFYTDDPEVLRLEFDTDTFHSTTMAPVHAIVNPNNGVPSYAEAGTRLLLAYDIENPSLWGGLEAHTWDIIETVDGTIWHVAFDASDAIDGEEQFVVNLKKMDLYKFTHGEWISAVLGRYKEGFWSFDVEKIVGT